MTLFLTVLHVIVCLLLIAVVLLQRGKGAEIGAVFGGGGSSTVFGSRGAGNFLTRLTTGAAIVFMFTSLTLAYFARDSAESTLFEEETPAAQQGSPFEEAGEPAPAEEPAADASPFEEVPAPAPAQPDAEASAEAEGGGSGSSPSP
ncbi:MAG: preprotein translocase subunit SecG [Myxococcota bacterium]|nr:preprotein translocase subunit SecG [Myxococcota bacterium]